MSEDIFIDPTLAPSRRIHHGLTPSSLDGSIYGGTTISVPRDPEMQRLLDARNLQKDIERARKEFEMDTPENREKAFEAEVAERKRRWIDFHRYRAIPRFVEEGWKHIRGIYTDEEIRVYTIDNERRRFWGIKPAGMDMFEFWDQNDPEVTR